MSTLDVNVIDEDLDRDVQVTFNYHPDMSGDVRVEVGTYADRTFTRTEVCVPGVALLQVAAEYVRAARIAEQEDLLQIESESTMVANQVARLRIEALKLENWQELLR